MESIDLNDMELPAGWGCSASDGWPSLHQVTESPMPETEYVEFSRTGQFMPGRFELGVVIPAAESEAEMTLLLYFVVSGDLLSIHLVGAACVNADVDIALARAKALHRIDWWKVKAIDQMHAQKARRIVEAIAGSHSDSEVAEVEQLLARSRSRRLAAPVSRRKNRITVEHLDAVADAYRSAQAKGEPTTRAVAAALSVSQSRAAHLVVEARKQGKLPPAKQ